jgi:hypothetical protein
LLAVSAILAYRAFTANASTLTVEGDGQIQEGTVFDCRRAPSQVGRITQCIAGKGISYAAGEAAQCYEPEVGVRRFRRHLVFLKPSLIVVLDDVELARPRGAEIHFVFCTRDPTTEQKPVSDKRLRIVNNTTAVFAGKRAGLVLRVPAALSLDLKAADCPLARNYTDQDSEYCRITARSARARKHRFLSLLFPLPDRRLRKMPEVRESADSRSVRFVIQWGAHRETLILMPLTRRAVDWEGLRFSGQLLVCDRVGQEVRALCGIGATEVVVGHAPFRPSPPAQSFIAEARNGRLKLVRRMSGG